MSIPPICFDLVLVAGSSESDTALEKMPIRKCIKAHLMLDGRRRRSRQVANMYTFFVLFTTATGYGVFPASVPDSGLVLRACAKRVVSA